MVIKFKKIMEFLSKQTQLNYLAIMICIVIHSFIIKFKTVI